MSPNFSGHTPIRHLGAHTLAYVLLCRITYALAQLYCGYYKAKAKTTLGEKLKIRIRRSSEILFPQPSGLSPGAGRSGTWCRARKAPARIYVPSGRSALPFQIFSRTQVWAGAQRVFLCGEGCVQMRWGQQVLTVVSGKYLGGETEGCQPTPVGRNRYPRVTMRVPRSAETCPESHSLRQDTDPGVAGCGARLSLRAAPPPLGTFGQACLSGGARWWG